MVRAPTRKERGIAAVVFTVVFAILMIAQRTQGNTRDEGTYFDAAELYWGWYGELGDNLVAGKPWKSFTRASVDRWFSYNDEHPALMKTLFGVSWRIFHKCKCARQPGHPIGYARPHRTLQLLDEQTAMRLPAAAMTAMMCAVVFLFGALAWSRAAGLVAAALTVFMPRLFFDAQLACFDAPIAALWVLVVYGYWRSLTTPKWAPLTGVAFGLALATKHNAFFLPFVLLAHYLWMHAPTIKRLLGGSRKLPPVPRVFLWMVTVGPPVYLALWPHLWFDTFQRWGRYYAFHAHHVYYNMEYLGRNYNKPPFPLSFPYVMTALTVPVTTLLLAAIGSTVLAREWLRARRQSKAQDAALAPTVEASSETPSGKKPGAGMPLCTGFLVGLNALFPMAIITVTRAPIFGATKHFHATLPFLALLAGCGLFAHLRAWQPSRRLAILLAVLVCLPAAAETWRSHPYGLTHYNLLAGGPPGGADLGMNRQFWGYATTGLLPWIDHHAAPGAPVYWHDTNQLQLNMDGRIGLVRNDLRNTGLEEPGVKTSDLALVIHEKHFNKYEYWIWDFYGTARPSVVLDVEGVPVVTLYQRRK